jgi:hypothetical protein
MFNIGNCPCVCQNGVWRFESILNLCTSGVSDQVHVPAALHKGNAPVVTESVRTYWRREKTPLHTPGIKPRFLGCLVAMPITLSSHEQ